MAKNDTVQIEFSFPVTTWNVLLDGLEEVEHEGTVGPPEFKTALKQFNKQLTDALDDDDTPPEAKGGK